MPKIKAITKKFSGITVLDSFSAEIRKGSVTALVSPSGKGKTTLLRIIAGLDKDFSGNVEDVGTISYCPQDISLFPWYSAEKNLTVVLGDSQKQKEDIRTALEVFGLLDAANKKPHELSGGMCQRVAIIRAWLANTDTVLLDEPFKGLDSETKSSVISYLKETKKDGRTVIFTTHSEDELTLFADDILKM